MSRIAQIPKVVQTNAAQIAHSGGSTSPTPEGELVVSSGGPEGGVKARAKARPGAPSQDARIAELEKQLDDLFISKEAEIEQWMERCELAEKSVAKLEGERDRANHAAAEMREFSRQIQAARDKKLNELDDDNRRLVKQNADLAAQVEALAAQLEETGAGEFEAQAARIALLEHEKADLHALVDRATARACEWQEKHAQAQAQAEQNARIAEEEHDQGRVLLEENTSLRGRVAELEKAGAGAGADVDVDDLRRQLAAALEENAALKQRNAHLEALHKSDDEYIMRLQERERWIKRAASSGEIEAATKLVAMAMRDACEGKGESYTAVYTEDIAKACGLNRQAAGRHMNAAVEWGMFGGYRTEEKAIVADARLGKREIKKKILHVAPTALLDRPEDWKRGDGKQHGGSTRRCKKCGAEDSLRVVPHTVCLACGYEDIFMPDDAHAALDRARSLQPEDAQAAVTEAMAIVAPPAPAPVQEEEAAPAQVSEPETTDVHLEQQSQPAPRADAMTLARAAGFPALVLADHAVNIAAGSPAWSRWMHMSRPTNAQISAVIASFKGAPAPFETPCEWCGSPETVWDPDGSGRRITACYVYPERRKSRHEQPAEPTHKAVDFSTGRVVEVKEP